MTLLNFLQGLPIGLKNNQLGDFLKAFTTEKRFHDTSPLGQLLRGLATSFGNLNTCVIIHKVITMLMI